LYRSDTRFFALMPAKLFAHRPEMADNYAKNPPFAEITARVRSNFLCNLGHGDPAGVMPKLPRLDFEEACRLL
jgi:hypothetical protein